MRLKRLTLHGFKTFAEKTELEFADGVTVIVGPNGSGKCVAGSSLVTLTTGQDIPIATLIDEALSKSQSIETLEDGWLTRDNPLGIHVLSVDPDTLRLQSLPVMAFVKRTVPDTMLRVTTRTGRTVTVTPCHPLFTCENARLSPIPAGNVKEGIRIAIPRILTQNSTNNTDLTLPFLETIRLFTENDSVYIPSTDALRSWMEEQRRFFGTYTAWANAAGIRAETIAAFRHGQPMQVKSFSQLARVADCTPPVEPLLKSKVDGYLQVPVYFSRELARFLGLLVAEGRNTRSSQIWFVNRDTAINSEYSRLANELFHLTVCEKHYKTNTEAKDLLLFSQTLCRLLEKLFAFPIGSTSFEKTIPQQVFSSPRDIQWEFLSGLFEGDAHLYCKVLSSGRRQAGIEFVTASPRLAEQVCCLLLRLGVIAYRKPYEKYASNTKSKTRRTYWRVSIYGSSQLRLMANHLRFVGTKQQVLDMFAGLQEDAENPNNDLIPGVNDLIKQTVKASGFVLKPQRSQWPKLMAYVEGRCEVSRSGLSETISHIEQHGPNREVVEGVLQRLRHLATSDIYWDVVTKVEKIKSEDPYVYDLCVPRTHNFIADGVVVHNSNVVDSLLWCLGEQKASSLRASKAQDVIFAGSAKRKPMGMAEVSLTVDNEDRFLPLDFSEVTVTRRIYRSGDSDYLINKVPCRLKDITDLFLDTGVGRGAYAIVNQSEIDSILSARPEDRRELFEEAAGIKKYRVRKREAQRKLENTEQNLLRVRDIAREIESQLEPLAAQAATARRWRELTDRLREIEVGLLTADYARYRDELLELNATAEMADREAEALTTEAANLEQSVIALGSRINEAEAEMDAARLVQQTTLAEGERIAGRIALSAERRAGALRAAETLERDLIALATEQTQRTADAERLLIEAKEALAERDRLTVELVAAEADATEVERALNELTRAVAGHEADFVEMARRLAAQKAEWDAVRARLAARAREIAESETRAQARAQEAAVAKQEVADLTEAAVQAIAVKAEAQRILVEEREPARLRAIERATAQSEQRTTLERRLAEQRARLAALEETEAAQEGYFAGVRSVTRAVQRQELTGRYQVVADAIRVPAELDTAIEVALGASLQDIITDTEAEAKDAIRYLNEKRGGRATFLPLDALRDTEVPDALIDAKRQFSGVLGSAALLVAHDPEVAAAVRVLLARVLIVDDLDTATRVSRRIRRDWGRIVTLSGEVVVPTGAITGGTQARQTANLLGRKREIAELTDAVHRGTESLRRLIEAETLARQEAETARLQVRDAQVDVDRARDALTQAERKRDLRQAEAERLARDVDSLRQRVTLLREAGNADTARESALAAAVSGSSNVDETAQATREEMLRRRTALTLRRDAVQQQVRSLSASVASLRERGRALSREAEQAKEAALRASIRSEERRKQAAEAQSIVAAEEAVAPEQQASQERIKGALNEATVRFEKWRDRRQGLLNENFQLTERIKAAERSARRALDQAQAARLKATRVEVQRDTIGQRLLEEYELHPESALALTEGKPVDRSTAQEIGRLRREIKALGNVNTGAVEEYERVSERSVFLREQQADLDQARAHLLAAIAEIDGTTRGVFMETFQAVEAAFFRLFVRLFGGGAAELQLTNPDDIFETGIDILAQPPGKKRQNLSLLSGGERALTATALLFAFLEVRPAPFCVLDEVDAPLDGANVEKYTELLRDFGKKSQFIVITHNPTTMEAAPLWYGVTMQEPGVSRGLSMRPPQVASPEGE